MVMRSGCWIEGSSAPSPILGNRAAKPGHSADTGLFQRRIASSDAPPIGDGGGAMGLGMASFASSLLSGSIEASRDLYDLADRLAASPASASAANMIARDEGSGTGTAERMVISPFENWSGMASRSGPRRCL